MRAARSRTEPTSGSRLQQLGDLIWTEFPLIMAMNVVVALAFTVLIAAMVVVPLLAPLAGAVVLGPVWIGVIATANNLLAGDRTGLRDLGGQIRNRARTGFSIALPPAIGATCLLLVLRLHPSHGGSGLLIVISILAAVITTLAIGLITIVPLAVLTDLRGRSLWIEALALTGRGLLPVLGVLALVVLLALSLRVAGPFVPLLISGPIALANTALIREKHRSQLA